MSVKIKHLNIILHIKKIVIVFWYIILNENVIKGVIIIIIFQNLRGYKFGRNYLHNQSIVYI